MRGKLLAPVVYAYNKVLWRVPWPRAFTTLHNSLVFLTSQKGYLKYIKTKKMFMDTDSGHMFAHHRRSWLYREGGISRGQKFFREYMLNLVPFDDGDIIIDCGANVGDLLLALNHIDKRIVYYGFEPSPVEFACLKENFHQSQNCCGGDVYNLALSDKAGDNVEFYVKSQTADSSILPIDDFESKISVEVDRLSNLLPGGNIKLLKLEAEGYEPEILLGLGDKVANVNYVSADVGFERGIDSNTTLPEVTNFLMKYGFEVAGFIGPPYSVRHALLFHNKKI